MEAGEIEKRVKLIMTGTMGINELDINGAQLLTRDLGIDSFGGLQLMFALKDEFDIEIPPDDLKAIETVSDIYDYIKMRVE